jgi:RNA recognition motif-containing protein
MVVRLYIGNLPFEVDDTELRSLLAPFGGVEEARVVTNARNKSRGFGFVTLETNTPDEVIVALNNRSVAGRLLRVHPAHAVPSFQRQPSPYNRDNRRGPPRREN